MDWNFKARAIERILIVCGGIISLVLGYLLFVKGVSGEASLIVEYDKTKIQIINALPGIFFALFGAVILIFALRRNVTASIAQPTSPGTLVNSAFDEPSIDFNEVNAVGQEAQHVTEVFNSGEYKTLHVSAHGEPPEVSGFVNDTEEPNKSN